MKLIDRRAFLQRALVLAGCAAIPGIGTEALAASPRLLDRSRFALLSAVADTMIPRTATPGASDVGVPRLFDGLLRNWASAPTRASLLGALDRIDARARAAHKMGFRRLDPARRLVLLTEHDAAALKPLPVAPAGARGRSSAEGFGGGSTIADPAYAKLKELVVVLYYSTEPALTQELVYEHSPGEWQPSIPLTPQTRASGSAGYF